MWRRIRHPSRAAWLCVVFLRDSTCIYNKPEEGVVPSWGQYISLSVYVWCVSSFTSSITAHNMKERKKKGVEKTTQNDNHDSPMEGLE